MAAALSQLDLDLMAQWQRGLPLVSHPFAVIGKSLGVFESAVLARLNWLQETGTIARVGATCRPNTAGVSTLAAIEVPEWRVDEVAQIVNAERAINHSYLRENDLNLWFVATAPNAADMAASIARISAASGLKVLEFPLVRAFNIDLGFALDGPRHALPDAGPVDLAALRTGDAPLMQALTDGLPLVPAPFAVVAAQLGWTEAEVLTRIKALQAARILTRVGIIVRHRALGWRSNAMVVWDLPEDRIEAAGMALARHPGVTLCYQRRPAPRRWPYALYCMIHGRSRAESLDVLTRARALPELAGATPEVLFSVRCFKQTGALVHRPEAAE